MLESSEKFVELTQNEPTFSLAVTLQCMGG